MMRKILVILICILCVTSCKTTKNHYRVKSVKVKSHPRVKWVGATSENILILQKNK
jgi:CxxC motif-containing protein